MKMASFLEGLNSQDADVMEMLYEIIDSDNHTVLITTVIVVSSFVVISVIVIMWKRLFPAKQKKKVLVVKQTEQKRQQHSYLISVVTGSRLGSGTKAYVQMTLTGKEGKSLSFNLNPFLHDPKRETFRRCGQDKCILLAKEHLGDLYLAEVELQSNKQAKWFLSYIVVQDMDSHRKWYFPYHDWIWAIPGCSARLALVPGVVSQLRLVGDNFLRGLRKHHIWRKLVVHLKSSNQFNAVMSLSYCNCLSLCFIFANTMVYRSLALSDDLNPSYTKFLLLSFLSNATVTAVTSFLEVGMVSVEHRNRFEYIDDSGAMMEEKPLKTANKLQQLNSSLWQPDLEGDYTGFDYPGDDDEMLLDDDVFEEDNNGQTPNLKRPQPFGSPVMSSLPLRSAIKIPLATGLPRDIAQATDSTYRIMEQERQSGRNIHWNEAAELYLFSNKSPVSSLTHQGQSRADSDYVFTESPGVTYPPRSHFSKTDAIDFVELQKNNGGGSVFRPVVNYQTTTGKPESHDQKVEDSEDDEVFENMHDNMQQRLLGIEKSSVDKPKQVDFAATSHLAEAGPSPSEEKGGSVTVQLQKKLSFLEEFESESGSELSLEKKQVKEKPLEIVEDFNATVIAGTDKGINEKSKGVDERSFSFEGMPATTRKTIEKNDLEKGKILRKEKMNDIITERMEEFLNTKTQMSELDRDEVRRILRTETNAPPHPTPSNSNEAFDRRKLAKSTTGQEDDISTKVGDEIKQEVSQLVYTMLEGFVTSVQKCLVLGQDVQGDTLAEMERQLVNVVESAKVSGRMSSERKKYTEEKYMVRVGEVIKKCTEDDSGTGSESQRVKVDRSFMKEVALEEDESEVDKIMGGSSERFTVQEEIQMVPSTSAAKGGSFGFDVDHTCDGNLTISEETDSKDSFVGEGTNHQSVCRITLKIPCPSTDDDVTEQTREEGQGGLPHITDIQDNLDLGPVSRKLSDMVLGQAYVANMERVEKKAEDILNMSKESRDNLLTLLSTALNVEIHSSQKEAAMATTTDYRTETNQTMTLREVKAPTNTNVEDNMEDGFDSACSPQMMVNKIPPEVVAKVKDEHVIKVAEATLQSVLSEDVSSRFKEIVSDYGRTELQQFSSDVVASLYTVVRQKLKSLLRLELHIDELNSDGVPVERSGETTGDQWTRLQSLLQAADAEVKLEVLPVVTEHLVSLILEEARTLETIDVDLMMLAFGGQFVETVVTNAVLQTHVGLVKGARVLFGEETRTAAGVARRQLEEITETKTAVNNHDSNKTAVTAHHQTARTSEGIAMVSEEDALSSTTLDIRQVLTKVVENLHNKLVHKSKKDLEDLMGDERKIHCGLCKPKVVDDITERLVHMSAARFITNEVFSKALKELSCIQEGECGGSGGGSGSFIDTTASGAGTRNDDDQRSGLMRRVGDVLKGSCHGDKTMMSTAAGFSSPSSSDEGDVVGDIVCDLTEYIIEYACGSVADQLITLMDLEGGETNDSSDGGRRAKARSGEEISEVIEQRVRDMLSCRHEPVPEDAVGCHGNSNCNAAGDPLENFPVSDKNKSSGGGLSSELEEIRTWLAQEKLSSDKNAVAIGQSQLTSTAMESEGSLYHMYYYHDDKKYRIVNKRWVFILVFGAIVALSLTCFVCSILIGLQFDDIMARHWLTSYSLAMFQHVFLLETLKVFFLAIFASICGGRLL